MMSAADPNGPIIIPDAFIDLCTYTGELSGWLAPTGAAIITATLALLGILWVRNRRRHAQRRAPQVAVTIVTVSISVLVTLALAVNSWVGYVPSFQALGRWLDGGTSTHDWQSTTRQQTTETSSRAFQVTIPASADRVPGGNAWVYLPPGYDQHPEMRYRIVVALHGDPGKGADWFVGGDIQRTLDLLIASGAIPPVILVSPDLSAGLGVNYREPVDLPNGPAIAEYVSTDVVGWIDSTFRTTAQSTDRIIAGFSSGGFGSLVIGVQHSAVFGGIVSLIPYTVPFTSAFQHDDELRARWDPAVLIGRARTVPPVFLGMAGLETPANGNRLAAALQSAGAVFTKRVFHHQAHTWQTAQIMMPYGLVWMSQQLGWSRPISGSMADFPQSCQPDPN